MRLFIVLFALLCTSGCFEAPVCLESSKVVEVESITYRGGYVRLENGMRVNVGQPKYEITVGYDYCIKYK